MERTDAFDKIFKAIMSEGQQENPLVTTFLHLSEGELIKRRGEEADEAAESERKRLCGLGHPRCCPSFSRFSGFGCFDI